MNKERIIELYLNGANANKCEATDENERTKWQAYEYAMLQTLDIFGYTWKYNKIEGKFTVMLKGENK